MMCMLSVCLQDYHKVVDDFLERIRRLQTKKSKLNVGSVLYLNQEFVIFTALHVMQTRYSDKNSVRPSVCHTRVL